MGCDGDDAWGAMVAARRARRWGRVGQGQRRGQRQRGPAARATAARASGRRRRPARATARRWCCTRARSPRRRPVRDTRHVMETLVSAEVLGPPTRPACFARFCPRANGGSGNYKSRNARRPARPSSRVRRTGHPFCPRGAGANSLKSSASG